MTVHQMKPAAGKTSSGYRMVARGAEKAEIYLYGVIGGDWFGEGVTAKQFADDLKALGAVKSIDLRVNSEGGNVFDGKTMYSLLAQHAAKVTAYIDGLAASAASFVIMAADEIRISEGAFIMIHDAYGVCGGRAEDMRSYATLLDQVNGSIRETYAARTRNDVAKIQKWMADETWFSGKDAIDAGFADTLVENLKVAAQVVDASKYKHLPTALLPRRAAAAARIAALMRRG